MLGVIAEVLGGGVVGGGVVGGGVVGGGVAQVVVGGGELGHVLVGVGVGSVVLGVKGVVAGTTVGVTGGLLCPDEPLVLPDAW